MNDVMTKAVSVMKRYGPPEADAESLPAPAGTVLLALGPNRAGKTTTARMLITLPRPDVSGARVDGHYVVRQAKVVQA